MSGFSNRPKNAPSRARFGDAIAELDRLMALPAGHPDILRAWGAAQKVPVPKDSYAELQAFADELGEKLDGLGRP